MIIKLSTIVVTIALLFGAPLLAATELSQKNTLKIGFSDDNPPWSYRKDGQFIGIAIDYYQALFKALDYHPVFIPFDNYPRIIRALILGQIDAASGLKATNTPLPQNDQLSCSRESIHTSPWGAYSLADSPIRPVKTPSELNQYLTGTARLLRNNHLSFMKEENVVSTLSPEHLHKLLRGRRIDLAFTTRENTRYWALSQETKTREILIVGNFHVHVCLSKSSLGEAKSTQIRNEIDRYRGQKNTADSSKQ